MVSFLEYFQTLHPAIQAGFAGLFTWGITAVGAALVFFTKRISAKFFTAMEGLAAGVMLAATYWSLLAPAIELSDQNNRFAWMPAAVGILAGTLVLSAVNRILPHLHRGHSLERAQGLRTTWSRHILLTLAITLHNVPEGLAVGVSFGAASMGLPDATFGSAIALAIGIGIQTSQKELPSRCQ